jgi:arginine deiminase
MALSVFSEIGRLREVMVHAPGPEVDCMPPSMMAELLFDDILYGPHARFEHQRIRAIMERLGVEVRDTRDLLAEALGAGREGVPALLQEIDHLEGIGAELIEELGAMPAAELADVLIAGLPALPEEMEPDYLFRLQPLPNLLFTRDAQVVLANGVIIGAMSFSARRREPLLSRFIFQHHPLLGTPPVYADFSQARKARPWPQNARPTLEGGDVLVFQEGVLVAGASERTQERALDLLVAELRRLGLFKTLIMVPMPRTRRVMHLDTIFTRLSPEECLVYAPMILPGTPETLSVISIDLARPGDWGSRRPSLLDALAKAGVRLEPISCGGPTDYIQQAREQWSDGANSFALAPGVVMLYSRNPLTAEELAKRGYHLISAAEMPFDAEGRCLYSFGEGKKYAILVAGEELSRARGGPRCMTMPLERERW